MPSLSFSIALRNARAQKIIDLLNAGAGPGTFAFYTAPRPATGAALTTQTLLGTVTLAEPAGSVSGGALTFNTITDDSLADAGGAAVWVRAYDGDGGFVIDMDVTDNAGAGPVKMPNTTVVAGGVLRVSSAVITEGNA